MRKLIRRTRRQERGVTTIVIALSFTALLAAAGMGVDTASLALQRSRVQHSADAAATAVAYDCAQLKLSCNPTDSGAKSTANFYANENSSGGTVTTPSTLTPASGSVQVRVDKSVPTNFFRAFGITSKNVGATATASWGKHPINGTVLPFAVSLCEFSRLPSGTSTTVYTDINDKLKSASSYAQSDPLLLTPQCPVPPEVSLPSNPTTISSFQGGLWLSTNEGANNVCNGKVDINVLALTYASAKNETCVKKYEDDLVPGAIVFMAVYAPNANYGHGGIRGSGGDIVDMKILGFAPFKITSRCLDKGCSPRPSIAGKFVTTIEPNPGFIYGGGVANFGATKVELIG